MSWPRSPPSDAPACPRTPTPQQRLHLRALCPLPRPPVLPLPLTLSLPTALLEGRVVSGSPWGRREWEPISPRSLPLATSLSGATVWTWAACISRLQFWNLEFESQSFLYKQVRRMTAVLVAVGLGTLMPAQVKVILESRDPLGRHQARVAPAHGLFLKSVLYRSLGGNPTSVQQESEEAPGWPKNPHLETRNPKARGLEACRTEATDNPQISRLRSGRPGHTALPPALAPLCTPHGPPAPHLPGHPGLLRVNCRQKVCASRRAQPRSRWFRFYWK
uniref:tRNA pseudouridine synthase n=1 Tax=Neovison vison TaxID=452646 RepID=A0A8C7AH40_NEOVI